MRTQRETIAHVRKPIMLGLEFQILLMRKLFFDIPTARVLFGMDSQTYNNDAFYFSFLSNSVPVPFRRLKTKVAVDHSVPSSNQSMSLKNQPLSRGTLTWNSWLQQLPHFTENRGCLKLVYVRLGPQYDLNLRFYIYQN